MSCVQCLQKEDLQAGSERQEPARFDSARGGMMVRRRATATVDAVAAVAAPDCSRRVSNPFFSEVHAAEQG